MIKNITDNDAKKGFSTIQPEYESKLILMKNK